MYFVCINHFCHLSEVNLVLYFVCINFVISVSLYCFVLCMYQFCHLSEVVLFCTLYVSILSSQWGCIVLYFVYINIFWSYKVQNSDNLTGCWLFNPLRYFVCINFVISVRLYCFTYFVCINFLILVRLSCFVLCMYQFSHLSEVVLFCTLYVSIFSS